MKKVRTIRLSDALPQLLGPALRRQGFGEAEIVTAWADLAGPRLAEVSAPLRIVWPSSHSRGGPDDGEPGALHVRVEGAFALEMQHLTPLIIERINARLGWRCVDRLKLSQGPAPRVRTRAAPPAEPTAQEMEEARSRVPAAADDDLRESLARLGARIMQRDRARH